MKQVTAAVIIEEGRLFIARRADGNPLAGLWELPGGKTEPGETPGQCLERELMEELKMASSAGEVVARTIHHHEHGSFELLALETRRLSGFELSVHDAHAWIEPANVPQYSLAPADVELVAQLIDSGAWL